MNLEIFLLNGYGQFVWPAFIFTFLNCLILFKKTKTKLQKYEKLFVDECKQAIVPKVINSQEEEYSKEILARSSL